MKTLKYNVLKCSHNPDLFMRGDLIGCQAPSGKGPLDEASHSLTASLIFVDNKRNKPDNRVEYFICYPYSLWENDTEM